MFCAKFIFYSATQNILCSIRNISVAVNWFTLLNWRTELAVKLNIIQSVEFVITENENCEIVGWELFSVHESRMRVSAVKHKAVIKS